MGKMDWAKKKGKKKPKYDLEKDEKDAQAQADYEQGIRNKDADAKKKGISRGPAIEK